MSLVPKRMHTVIDIHRQWPYHAHRLLMQNDHPLSAVPLPPALLRLLKVNVTMAINLVAAAAVFFIFYKPIGSHYRPPPLLLLLLYPDTVRVCLLL